ncbi:MAG: hypothetical protein DU429_07975 [Candidatus Tokpelaia sp.]|nr:MAG: hypothetical protein DU429_07975 [Candidatus Tokpelaia sp.]KAA6206084.1 MAG: hypothetical protein DU430_02290 [Candidatus Tokpelaia sp.]
MPMRFPLFLAPLVIFGYIFAEIAAFIFVGSKIGIVPSLLLVLLSSLAGIGLLRGTIQGFSRNIKAATRQNNNVDKAVIRRLISCVSAILLIVPGFISSLCGLIMLLPPIQAALADFIRKNGGDKASFTFGKRPTAGGTEARSPRRSGRIIDLEPENYHARDPENSPWKKP